MSEERSQKVETVLPLLTHHLNMLCKISRSTSSIANQGQNLDPRTMIVRYDVSRVLEISTSELGVLLALAISNTDVFPSPWCMHLPVAYSRTILFLCLKGNGDKVGFRAAN